MNDTMKLLDKALANSAQEDASKEDKNTTVSGLRTANALSSVINYIITDAFDLHPEESLWVSYYLGQILEPLKTIQADVLLAAVDRELNCGEYSDRMIKRVSATPYTHTYEDSAFVLGVRYAPVADWVEGISDIILSSYPNLRPMIRSSIVGSIHGLFLELGVSDNPRKSRPSLYLPNSVRFILEANKEK